MTVTVHLTPKSSNRKVGPIPVTTTSSNSCPSICPLKDAGCYAQSGPLNLHWKKVSGGLRGGTWEDLLEAVRNFPEGQLWRHNQAGDLPQDEYGTIDSSAVASLVRANKGRQGFTYTHHDMTDPINWEAVRSANASGFTVNLSANSPAHADELLKFGVGPVVSVIGEYETQNSTTPGGARIVVCPATTRDDVNCSTCKLCAKSDRTVVIGFPVHGARRRTAARTVGV